MATLHKTDDAKQMMRSDPDGQMQQSKTIFCIKPRLATYPQCKQVPKQHRNNEKGAIIMLLSGLVLRQMERWSSDRCKSQPFPRWDGRVWSHPCHLGTDWTQPFLGCPVHTPHEFCERGVPMLEWDQ